jgi:hypothetical protein
LSGHVAIEIFPQGDCLFNSLGVAAEYVKTRVFPTNLLVARQEGLGGWARREIVAFLRRNKESLSSFSRTRRTTWEGLYELLTDEELEHDVPVGKTYERYQEWLLVKGNWEDMLCILAGQKAFGVPVISNVVYRYPRVWTVTVGFSDDPSLLVISQATLTGPHYTLWLPRQPQDGRTSLDISGKTGRETVDLSEGTAGPATWPAGPATGPTGPTGPMEPSTRPVRVRKKPVKLNNYVETVDLRSIDLKRYKKRAVPHNRNNLFAAVRVATGDARSVAELRRLCADSVTSRTFARLAREYGLTSANLARHAKHLRNRSRAIEYDLCVLAHITRRRLVVKDGRSLRSFQSPVASHRQNQEPALLQVTRYYNALILEACVLVGGRTIKWRG